ncbi:MULTISPECIES: alpha/beta fold hydrolase [Prochlorococcus]|nr:MULTISPECIES: alpha/beta fold hydrolase [Prochlorococcus]
MGHSVYCCSNSPDLSREALIKSPAVLLIHGFGASTDHWRHNLPVISTFCEVHAIDLLGFGRSSKPAGLEYGGPLWKDQVSAYVKEKIGRPTVLVGNSLGGYAALAAGCALGDEAAGVVLLNAAGRFSEEKVTVKGFWSTARKTFADIFLKNALFQRILFENLRQPSTIRRTLNQVYIDSSNVDDDLVESIRRPSLDKGAFGVFRSVFEPAGPQGRPLDELFAQLSSPLLLVWGNQDPWMNAPSKRAMYSRFTPASTKEVILDAGHCPHDEVPEKVNTALLEWLKTL